MIEVLFSIAIVVAVATFTLVGFKGIRVKSLNTFRLSDVNQIRDILALYRADNGMYPSTLTPGQPLVGPNGKTYVGQVPANRADELCPNPYSYQAVNNGLDYNLDWCLSTKLEQYAQGNCTAFSGSLCCDKRCDNRCSGSDGCGGICSVSSCSVGQTCNSGTCCIPSCSGKCGGDDSCGGTCTVASCTGEQTCYNDLCCTAQCTGKCGGDDSCGGTCTVASCTGGQTCYNDLCCTAQCTGKICGSNSCGGTCGAGCPSGKVCSYAQTSCVTPLATAYQVKYPFIVPVNAVIANNSNILVDSWGTLTGNNYISKTTDLGQTYTNTSLISKDGQIACDDDCSSMASTFNNGTTRTLGYSFNSGANFSTRTFGTTYNTRKILLSNAASGSQSSKVLLVPNGTGYLMLSNTISGSFANIGLSRSYLDATMSGDGTKICATVNNDRNIYCSDDSGANFYAVDTGVLTAYPYYNGIDMSDNGQVVALYSANSTQNITVRLTTNRSGAVATWTNPSSLPVSTGLSTSEALKKIDVSANGSQVIVPGFNTYKSSDYGNSWSLIKSYIYPSNNQPAAFSASADGSRLLFSKFTYGYMQVSTNGGNNWSKGGRYAVEKQQYSSAVNGDGNIILISGGYSGTYKSINRGVSFTSLTDDKNCFTNFCYVVFNTMDMDSTGSKLIATGSNYLTVSSDGGSTLTSVMFNKAWRDARMNSNGTKAIAANCGEASGSCSSDGYLYASSDSLATWQRLDSADARNWINVDIDDAGNNMVAVDSYNQVYYSHNGGVNWQNSIMPADNSNYRYTRSIRSDSTGRYVMMTRQKGVLVSSDYGVTFAPSIVYNGSLDLRSGSVCRSGDLMIAGGYFLSNNLAYSTDKGQTWSYKTVDNVATLDCDASGQVILMGHYVKDYITIFK